MVLEKLDFPPESGHVYTHVLMKIRSWLRSVVAIVFIIFVKQTYVGKSFMPSYCGVFVMHSITSGNN